MTATDYRAHSDDELRVMMTEASNELADLKFNNRITPVENPHRMQELRRSIARMKTVIAERRQTPQPASEAKA